MTTRPLELPRLAAYYWNGAQVTRSQAKALLADAADRQGYESENWANAWARANASEEAREFLNELSGYALEIVAN